MEIVTRPACVSDLDAAAEVLGDAFADYPWTRWTVDPSDHRARIVALQRLDLENLALPFGGVSVTTVGDRVQSVAAWIDTAAVSAGTVDPAVESRSIELQGSRYDASRAAERQVAGLRPDDRHFYLGTVGTATAEQGRGLAKKTLAPLLRAGNDRALDVWLETSSPSNVGFYRRLGFTVTDHVVIDAGGPPVWVMVRRPE